jgi:UDP-N-acetyl-2-amino-2-deoxyglucuronate dehydrogenase
MATTSVAFIGRAGTPHQDAYLNTLPLMDGVDRVHVCDLAGGALFGEAQQRLGALLGNTYTDPDECIAAGPYTFVIVSLDNRAANPIVMKALAAGNHVFAEKTAARSYAEFVPLERYAREHGLHLGMGYLNRARPSVIDARQLIAEGAIGRIYGFQVLSVATQSHLRDPENNWTFSREKAGGGHLIWLGCHYIDLLRFVSGQEVSRVSTITGVPSGLDLEVEEGAALSMALDSGALGTANFGYYLDGKSPLGGHQSGLTFWGEMGWLRMRPGEDDEVPLEIYSHHPRYAAVPYRTIHYTHASVPKAYGSAWGLDFMNQFLSACRDGSEPPLTASDAGAVLRVIDAAYESAESGCTVTVAPSA